MRQVTAKRNYLLLHDDGTIHYPFSKFLTSEFDNPNTRELVSQSLRIFYRFCIIYAIELAVRAIEGMCLTYDECRRLANFCYMSLSDVESLSDKKLLHLSSAQAGKPPKSLPSAVEPNTAQRRLRDIARYLRFYRDVILEQRTTSNLRSLLSSSYDKSSNLLQAAISGTKEGHHLQIQSLPTGKFLDIIRAIVVRPEELFVTETGRISRTLQRSRAMALLACEGLRPGAIGNVARKDFHENSLHLVVEDHREKREEIKTSTPLLKLGDSAKVNSASEGMIKIWPFTADAISEYINNEREVILAKGLRNGSRGFLFLNEKGEPIKHRASITTAFNGLGKRLAELGLLDVGDDPYFRGKKRYDFYAYVLRHSSVCLFLEQKGTEERSLDQAKARFLWTKSSVQPQRYAARVLSDQASINLIEFYESLMSEVRAKRER